MKMRRASQETTDEDENTGEVSSKHLSAWPNLTLLDFPQQKLTHPAQSYRMIELKSVY
jgi:hypothetical protein